MTPREYYCLSDVQQTSTRLWAIAQASFHNASFTTDGVPYTAADFLGEVDRAQRVQEKQLSDYKVAQINRQLTMAIPRPLRKGEATPEGLPLWCQTNPPRGDNVQQGAN